MAGPETQFGQASLQVPQPSYAQYHPQAVQIPMGAGQLWAEVGKNAMAGAGQVFQTLMNSPLNPEVRAKMQYGASLANYGQQVIAHNQALGEKGYWISSATPQGAEIQAPGQIQNPTLAAQWGVPGGTGTVTDVDRTGQPTQPTQPPPAPPQKTPPDTGDLGKPTTQVTTPTANRLASANPPGPDQFQGPNQAQTDAAIKESLARNQFASSGQGVPAGYRPPPSQYFLNPATGSYEQLQPPAAPSGAPPPQQAAAPPQQGAPPQHAIASDQGGLAGPTSEQLANWQAQNVHPVVSIPSFMNWYKNNVSSMANGATYSQNGGVNGEPAFVVHFPKGGTSMVSVSQIARTPSGRAMLQQENPSEVLEQQHQQSQAAAAAGQQAQQYAGGEQGLGPGLPPPGQAQPAGTPAQPAGTPAQPQAQPPQFTNPATGNIQPLQPPAAPGQPAQPDLSTLGQYTNVTGTGQPTPGLTAQTTGASQPAPPTYGFDSSVVRPAPNMTAAQIAAVQAAQAGKGDSLSLGQGFDWKRDTDPNSKGYKRYYTTMPGTAGNYFDEQRFYLGDNGYKLFELPNSSQEKAMQDFWVDKVGELSRSEVEDMAKNHPEQMKPWLRRAWQIQTLRNQPVDQGADLTLDKAERLHNTVQEIKDAFVTMVSHGMPVNYLEKFISQLQMAAQGAGFPRKLGPITLGPGMDEDRNNAMRYLEAKINQAHDYLTEQMNVTPGKTSEVDIKTPQVPILWGGITIPGMGMNLKPADVLNDVFSGNSPGMILDKLNRFQGAVDDRYHSMVDQQAENLQRVTTKHYRNLALIDTGKQLPDKENDYANHTFPQYPDIPTVTDKTKAAPSATPTPTATPTPSPTPRQFKTSSDLQDYLKTNPPSGTHLSVWNKRTGKYEDWTTP